MKDVDVYSISCAECKERLACAIEYSKVGKVFCNKLCAITWKSRKELKS